MDLANGLEAFYETDIFLSRSFREKMNRNIRGVLAGVKTNIPLSVRFLGREAEMMLRGLPAGGSSQMREALNEMFSMCMVATGIHAGEGLEVERYDQQGQIIRDPAVEEEEDDPGIETYTLGPLPLEMVQQGMRPAEYIQRVIDSMSRAVERIRLGEGAEDVYRIKDLVPGNIMIEYAVDTDVRRGRTGGPAPIISSSNGGASDSSSSSSSGDTCILEWESYWDCTDANPAWSTASQVFPPNCGQCSDGGWVYDRCENNRVYYRRTICDGSSCNAGSDCTHQMFQAKPTIGRPPEADDCCCCTINGESIGSQPVSLSADYTYPNGLTRVWETDSDLAYVSCGLWKGTGRVSGLTSGGTPYSFENVTFRLRRIASGGSNIWNAQFIDENDIQRDSMGDSGALTGATMSDTPTDSTGTWTVGDGSCDDGGGA